MKSNITTRCVTQYKVYYWFKKKILDGCNSYRSCYQYTIPSCDFLEDEAYDLIEKIIQNLQSFFLWEYIPSLYNSQWFEKGESSIITGNYINHQGHKIYYTMLAKKI